MLTFYQLPEVDVHLFRGLTLEGKATQVVWAWGYRCVDEDPARRLRTPGGTDFTVARVCLVIWERQGASECSVSPPLVAQKERPDIPLRVFTVLRRLLVPWEEKAVSREVGASPPSPPID